MSKVVWKGIIMIDVNKFLILKGHGLAKIKNDKGKLFVVGKNIVNSPLIFEDLRDKRAELLAEIEKIDCVIREVESVEQ